MLITGKQLEIVHYVTDSPFSQYRTKVMFFVVANRQEIIVLQACWDYFEAGHGKGSCDGIGGTVKRVAEQASKHGTAKGKFNRFNQCNKWNMLCLCPTGPKNAPQDEENLAMGVVWVCNNQILSQVYNQQLTWQVQVVCKTKETFTLV